MAKLGKKKIEAAARSAVEDWFVDCEKIHVEIATNDKTIAWDGDLFLYDDSRQTKDSLYGRIPLQVKGVTNNGIHKNTTTYPIQKADLKAYKDEGIAFFVVNMNTNTHQRTVYFALLAPIEVRDLLAKCGENKSKTVSFKKMDFKKTKDIESTLRMFYDDCKRQKSTVDSPVLSFEDLKKLGNPELTVFGYTNTPEPIPRLLAKNDYFVYANVGQGSVKSLYPVGTGKCSITVSGVYQNPVTVGERVFFNYYSITNNRECDVISIGKSFTMTIPKNESNNIVVKVDFNGTKYPLSETIKELEFLLALANEKHLYIAGCDYDMTQADNQTDSGLKGLLDLQDPYDRLVKLKKALDLLHVEDELDLSLMKKKDERLIDVLIDAFVNGKEIVENKKVGLFSEINICNLNILVTATKTGTNKYQVEDFFHSHCELKGSFGEDVFPITPYSILNKDRILKYSNIDFEQILPSFKANLKTNPNCFQLANNLGLFLLIAYDEQQNKDERLLDTSLALFDWLNENAKEELLMASSKINILQIKKRLGKLNDSEKDELYDMAENSMSDDFRFAAYLLLDEKSHAMRFFHKLNVDVRNFYRTLPIFHFVNN